MKTFPSKISGHSGQSLPEYALCLALVTLFCLFGLQILGQSFSEFFLQVGSSIEKAVANKSG